MSPSPTPATSNGANGFPVRRFPGRFTSRVMRPIRRRALSRMPSVATPYSTSSSRISLHLDVQPPPRVLQTTGRGYHQHPCLPCCWRHGRPVGLLRSTGVTPLPRYYEPVLHPLAFRPLPRGTGYRADLTPPISRRDEEGFSSCSARPRHRAVAPTPPEGSAASATLRRVLPPSPSAWGLGLRGLGLSGPARRSLTLRPGDSLTILSMAWSVGFRALISRRPATPVTGGWLFPRRVWLPLNAPAFAGRTRRWSFSSACYPNMPPMRVPAMRLIATTLTAATMMRITPRAAASLALPAM